MKLTGTMSLAGLGLVTLVAAAAVACGGGTATGNDGGPGSEGGGGKTDSGNVDTGPGITFPTMPKGPTTSSSTQLNFALHQLYLGDTDYGGMPGQDTSAWAKMGYNIDGKITTTTSTNVCKLNMSGGSLGQQAQLDGNGGIDNSFGENIYGVIIRGVLPTAAETILTDLNAGEFTLMFDVKGLDTTTTQTATGLSAQAFVGGNLENTMTTPTWEPSFNWPIIGNSPGATLLTKSTVPFVSSVQFPDAYVVNGTWVSGTPTTISLSISLSGNSLSLAINQAVITFDHSSGNHAGNGVISGVLDTADLISDIKGIAGRLSPTLCTGDTLDSVIQEITDSSDIMSNGTNPGPSVTCDAISIGLGFQADVIAQPTELEPFTCPKPDPCTDAGSTCDSGAPPPVDSGTKDSAAKDAGEKDAEKRDSAKKD
jgi:hypothetical protein